MTSPKLSSAILSESVDGFLLLFLSLRGILFSNDGLLACFCHKLTFNQTGGFDHSVFDTLVQLTEGRSARDQPKQPPAKKMDFWLLLFGFCVVVLGVSSTRFT